MALQQAAAWHCDALTEGVHFDLKPLDGVRDVVVSRHTPPTTTNITYTFDPCKPIKKSPNLPADEQCPSGTQLCRTQLVIKDGKGEIVEVTPIAGDVDGRSNDPDLFRLKSRGDSEGLRVEMHGGEDGEGNPQTAIIDFICDRSAGIGAPSFQSDDRNVVRLKWPTRHACEDGDAGKEPDKIPDDHSRHGGDGSNGDKGKNREDNITHKSWGFFTWYAPLPNYQKHF